MGAPYVYDISILRVKDLTFILLTWRKWLAPNNASRQQMGFNSGFKGLSKMCLLKYDLFMFESASDTRKVRTTGNVFFSRYCKKLLWNNL